MSFRRVLLLVCTLQLSAHAQQRRIFDRIVAIVDHDPILLSELHAAARPLLRIAPEDKQQQTLRETLDRVIDAHLVRREAAKKGLKATDTEIEQAMDQIQKQAGVASRQALLDEIERQGMTLPEYRAELEQQILSIRLVQLSGVKTDSNEKFERARKEYMERLRKSAYIEVRL